MARYNRLAERKSLHRCRPSLRIRAEHGWILRVRAFFGLRSTCSLTRTSHCAITISPKRMSPLDPRWQASNSFIARSQDGAAVRSCPCSSRSRVRTLLARTDDDDPTGSAEVARTARPAVIFRALPSQDRKFTHQSPTAVMAGLHLMAGGTRDTDLFVHARSNCP